ncbi:MAG: type II toxin-antitoxin system VapC family toxin [Burkholderiaceae bacterium]|nr:type II toxin-antitoxin system VapC family toxin [Burkholderiaceae bacterium]MDP1968642.1 type II toxin-antitoxin system VapC family toxin [Burkholderiaceae bacterium]
MSASIVLADTNVISEFVKNAPDPRVMRWLQSVQLMAISAITLEEAHFGLAWQPITRKLALFNAMVERMHAVYPVTPAIAQRGGVLRGQFQAQGIVRSAPDMLIAATAMEHQLVLATRNVRDFTGCGVQLVNPFEEA